MDGFAGFDPGRGSDRAWLFGIAARVFAAHCEQSAGSRDAVARLRGHRSLDKDEIEELTERIDAEREGVALMRRCERLPAVERAAIELVDLEGLTPKEAALALGVSRVAFRKRLSRARSRLRKEHQPMTKFTDNLWSDLVREHGPTLAHAGRPDPGRVGGSGAILRRPRVVAGSTLALAGVGAALVLALGGSAATRGVRRHDEPRRLRAGETELQR